MYVRKQLAISVAESPQMIIDLMIFQTPVGWYRARKRTDLKSSELIDTTITCHNDRIEEACRVRYGLVLVLLCH